MESLVVQHLAFEAESHRRVNGLETFSQAHQDLFALAVNGFVHGGVYREIGAGDPKESSNTFLLESRYGWSGLSIEINQNLCEKFNRERVNHCACLDAKSINWDEFVRLNYQSKEIDYLSLDIDPAPITLSVLEAFDLSTIRPRAITFEHDRYSQGDQVMNKSREIFARNRYLRVAENVKATGRDFEDWYLSEEQAARTNLEIHTPFSGECAEVVAKVLACVKASSK